MENTPQIFYTKIELVIHSFVTKYGVDELIKWLNEYSKEISPTDYNIFHQIQKAVCEVYQIPIADINSTSSTSYENAEAKRLISYLTSERTNLKAKHIASLQMMTPRSIYNHIKEVRHQIKNPKNFSRFIKTINQTLEILNPCKESSDH